MATSRQYQLPVSQYKPHPNVKSQFSQAMRPVEPNIAIKRTAKPPPPPPPTLKVDRTLSLKNGSPIVSIQMLKTKICADFQNNRCIRGDKCPYAHGETEIRHLPDLRKTKICISHIAGKCNSLNCNFAHSKDELRYTCQFPQYKTDLCRFHLAEGSRGCKYGDKCPYAHDRKELRNSTNILPSLDKDSDVNENKDQHLNYTTEETNLIDKSMVESANRNHMDNTEISNLLDSANKMSSDEAISTVNMKKDKSSICILDMLNKSDNFENDIVSNTVLNPSTSTSSIWYDHINNGDISVSSTPSILESVNSEESESIEGSIGNKQIYLPTRLTNSKSRISTVNSSKMSSSKKSSRAPSVLYPDVASVPVPSSPTSSPIINTDQLNSLNLDSDVDTVAKELKIAIKSNNPLQILYLINSLLVSQSTQNQNTCSSEKADDSYIQETQHYKHDEHCPHDQQHHTHNPNYYTHDQQARHNQKTQKPHNHDKHYINDNTHSASNFLCNSGQDKFMPLGELNIQNSNENRCMKSGNLRIETSQIPFPDITTHNETISNTSLSMIQGNAIKDNNLPIQNYSHSKDVKCQTPNTKENAPQPDNLGFEILPQTFYDKMMRPPPGFESIFRPNFRSDYSQSHFLAERIPKARYTLNKETKPLLTSIFHQSKNPKSLQHQ